MKWDDAWDVAQARSLKPRGHNAKDISRNGVLRLCSLAFFRNSVLHACLGSRRRRHKRRTLECGRHEYRWLFSPLTSRHLAPVEGS